jgi:dephospho-CoA kinase
MKTLTDIVWPLTRARLEEMRREEAAGTAVLVLEAAVLIEAGWTDLVDEVWVVSAPVDTARDRLMARNGISREQADARIGSQLTNEEREAHARLVIENDGSLEDLERRVAEVWASLRARAGAAVGGQDRGRLS